MELITTNDLLPPQTCVICHNSVANDEVVVDTGYVLDTGYPTTFEGREYVCEQCAKLLGRVFGTATTTEVKQAEFDRDVARQELINVRQRVDQLAKQIADDINSPVVQYQGASFEDSFQPPDTEQVRKASANRLSAVESRSEPAKDTSGSSRTKSKTASSGENG